MAPILDHTAILCYRMVTNGAYEMLIFLVLIRHWHWPGYSERLFHDDQRGSPC